MTVWDSSCTKRDRKDLGSKNKTGDCRNPLPDVVAMSIRRPAALLQTSLSWVINIFAPLPCLKVYRPIKTRLRDYKNKTMHPPLSWGLRHRILLCDYIMTIYNLWIHLGKWPWMYLVTICFLAGKYESPRATMIRLSCAAGCGWATNQKWKNSFSSALWVTAEVSAGTFPQK